MVSLMKGIIKHFSKSSYSIAKLQEEYSKSNDGKTLKAFQKIGRTRFGTHWMAATSLDPTLESIRKLVMNGTMKFKVCRHIT